MATKSIKIDDENIYEWLCSTGFLLPSNEVELSRFERLYPVGTYTINETAIDPLAIINGTRQRKNLSVQTVVLASEEQELLRMAARKHEQMPQEIIDQIKRNQQRKDDRGTDDK
jgi:hypothetical protein